ncbi:type II toxin-antitoxin system RelE/ParE family toxin [aff. Roholtiella sp. LEGE 12411]|uniref:type II toxin-antitoxin system RelE/ParE family toxin n=1 Tax=aff. Roholtiella sp. LEGE 12411 TaxID=1828822 RepID=UPI001ABCF85A|nr:type II toxin-antitoxin system YoeB family toxin [aff. Roholtiella sp. LEGE 12411]
MVWSPIFIRAFKRVVKKNPELRFQIEQVLQQIAEDPFQPNLGSHQLKGDLSGIWSSSINYSTRIFFNFVVNPGSGEEYVLLLTLDFHDDVYYVKHCS